MATLNRSIIAFGIRYSMALRMAYRSCGARRFSGGSALFRYTNNQVTDSVITGSFTGTVSSQRDCPFGAKSTKLSLRSMCCVEHRVKALSARI